jgi:Uma2 family endonuclease
MSAVMNDWILPHRITVDEYYRMAEASILPPDARVELIEGVIIDMAPIGSSHAGTVNQLTALLWKAAGDLAQVRPELVVRLGDFSEPQPDIALVKPRADFYKGKHPTADDTLLLIEVSESILRYDLEVKAALYARHDIPEYWIADLQNKQLRLFRSPRDGKYTDLTSIPEPRGISPMCLPAMNIDLSGVFSSTE